MAPGRARRPPAPVIGAVGIIGAVGLTWLILAIVTYRHGRWQLALFFGLCFLAAVVVGQGVWRGRRAARLMAVVLAVLVSTTSINAGSPTVGAVATVLAVVLVVAVLAPHSSRSWFATSR